MRSKGKKEVDSILTLKYVSAPMGQGQAYTGEQILEIVDFAAGNSDETVIERYGVSQSTLSRWRKGIGVPPKPRDMLEVEAILQEGIEAEKKWTLPELCRAYNITIDVYFAYKKRYPHLCTPMPPLDSPASPRGFNTVAEALKAAIGSDPAASAPPATQPMQPTPPALPEQVAVAPQPAPPPPPPSEQETPTKGQETMAPKPRRHPVTEAERQAIWERAQAGVPRAQIGKEFNLAKSSVWTILGKKAQEHGKAQAKQLKQQTRQASKARQAASELPVPTQLVPRTSRTASEVTTLMAMIGEQAVEIARLRIRLASYE